MREYRIRLSWPARCLHPNGRTDRRRATPSRQKAREEGWAEAKRVGAQIEPDAHLELTFFPPDARKRDLDGLMSSVKPHLDGIAEAAGVDDAEWTFTLRKGPKVKDGAVVVHVKDPDSWRSIGEIVTPMMRGSIS